MLSHMTTRRVTNGLGENGFQWSCTEPEPLRVGAEMHTVLMYAKICMG